MALSSYYSRLVAEGVFSHNSDFSDPKKKTGKLSLETSTSNMCKAGEISLDTSDTITIYDASVEQWTEVHFLLVKMASDADGAVTFTDKGATAHTVALTNDDMIAVTSFTITADITIAGTGGGGLVEYMLVGRRLA